MIRRGLALSLLLVLGARAADDAAAKALEKRRTLCNLLHSCRVPGEGARCTEVESAPIEGTELDANYCSWVRTFAKKGILPGPSVNNELYRRMGSQYHIMYVMHDTVPVPASALNHLVRNVPLTCKLINSYRKTSYSAAYPILSDSSLFSGTNGKNLTGTAKQVWVGAGGLERVYYGEGKVSILTWKMRGDVVVELRFWPRSATSCNYSARFTMFPVNGFINSVMNMGIFKSTAIDKIQEVLTDISRAANSYAQGKPPKVPQNYTPSEQASLKRFEELFRAGN